MSLAIVWSCLC